jgi:hypothetical protein
LGHGWQTRSKQDLQTHSCIIHKAVILLTVGGDSFLAILRQLIDIVETIYRGASKGRGLVVSPKGEFSHLSPTNFSTSSRFPPNWLRNVSHVVRLFNPLQVLSVLSLSLFYLPLRISWWMLHAPKLIICFFSWRRTNNYQSRKQEKYETSLLFFYLVSLSSIYLIASYCPLSFHWMTSSIHISSGKNCSNTCPVAPRRSYLCSGACQVLIQVVEKLCSKWTSRNQNKFWLRRNGSNKALFGRSQPAGSHQVRRHGGEN